MKINKKVDELVINIEKFQEIRSSEHLIILDTNDIVKIS